MGNAFVTLPIGVGVAAAFYAELAEFRRPRWLDGRRACRKLCPPTDRSSVRAFGEQWDYLVMAWRLFGTETAANALAIELRAHGFDGLLCSGCDVSSELCRSRETKCCPDCSCFG